MRAILRSVLILLSVLVTGFSATPARAEYCTTIAFDGARFPDGDCTGLATVPITVTGYPPSEMRLLVEDEARRGVSVARVTQLHEMLAEVTHGAGSALSRIGGLGLPRVIHVVIVNDAGPDGASAETVKRSGGTDDCPIMLYAGATAATGRLARTLAHELFHCAQYRAFPHQTGPTEARWWTEGSAEWFEDYALPGRVLDSDLHMALRTYRARSGTFSLLEGTYANLVFFTWLGPSRIRSYMSMMAEAGDPQLDAAIRALPESDYQRYAQDYIDEHIVTPSGVRVAGPEFGPSIPPLHTTTGIPGSDPVYYPEADFAPLVVMRGTFTFAQGEYAPSGQFGTRRAVFSERAGAAWGELPARVSAACGSPKTYRVAAMLTTRGRLRVDPGTRAGERRSCACPVGSWTIPDRYLESFSPSPDYHFVRSGEVSIIFQDSGVMTFRADNLRYDGPVRFPTGPRGVSLTFGTSITRSYTGRYKWEVSGDTIMITQLEPSKIKEVKSEWVRGPVNDSKDSPPRIAYSPSDQYTGRKMRLHCEGDRMQITPPLERVSLSRVWVDADPDEVHYPQYGIYQRQ